MHVTVTQWLKVFSGAVWCKDCACNAMIKILDTVLAGCLTLAAASLPQAVSSVTVPVGVQSLAEIQQAVGDFVRTQNADSTETSVEVKPLDKRLRLAACDQPLDTFWSPGSRSMGRVTVQVECASPKPWRVHVQSTVTMEGLVWTLDRSVRRGDVLTQGLLQQVPVKIGANNPALRSSAAPIVDIESWIGFAFSQRVSAGMVLDERMLKPPVLVEKGEAVLIVHQSAGLQLQTNGVALTNAAMGKRVQVRNTSSGKVLEATAVARGLVEVLR